MTTSFIPLPPVYLRLSKHPGCTIKHVAVFAAIRCGFTDLGAPTNLSPATVAKSVRWLRANGFITDEGPVDD